MEGHKKLKMGRKEALDSDRIRGRKVKVTRSPGGCSSHHSQEAWDHIVVATLQVTQVVS